MNNDTRTAIVVALVLALLTGPAETLHITVSVDSNGITVTYDQTLEKGSKFVNRHTGRTRSR